MMTRTGDEAVGDVFEAEEFAGLGVGAGVGGDGYFFGGVRLVEGVFDGGFGGGGGTGFVGCEGCEGETQGEEEEGFHAGMIMMGGDDGGKA